VASGLRGSLRALQGLSERSSILPIDGLSFERYARAALLLLGPEVLSRLKISWVVLFQGLALVSLTQRSKTFCAFRLSWGPLRLSSSPVGRFSSRF